MDRLVTDLKILQCVYDEYAAAFDKHSKEAPTRSSKIYVPIDVEVLAVKLSTNAHELFGRLYYHLDHKYRYTQDDGSKVHLFASTVGEDPHCINYPYLAAILAEYRSEHRKTQWSLWLSVASLAIAIGALVAQILGN